MTTDLENYRKSSTVFQKLRGQCTDAGGLFYLGDSIKLRAGPVIKFAYCVVETRYAPYRTFHDCWHRLCLKPANASMHAMVDEITKFGDSSRISSSREVEP